MTHSLMAWSFRKMTTYNPEAIQIPIGYNKHHVFWPRKDYKTKVEKNFRQHYGLVVPTPIINHNILHSRVSSPDKPGRVQMLDCMEYLDSLPDAVKMAGFWGVERSAQFFEREGREDIAQNLTEQLGYLSLKLVSPKFLATCPE